MDEQKPREIKPFQNPELVVLRNPVAKARFGLSLVQQKFLFEVLAFFKSQPDQRVARFNIREYFGKLGISTNNLREYVKEVEEMRRLDIKIPTGDNSKGINFIGVTLFASVEYRVGDGRSGYIEVEVSDKLKPYFLEIAKGDFFSYHILNTRVLKSTYSIKLYLLLKSYARLGRLEIALDELKDILEVDPATYKQYPDFRKRVLERAKQEMREKNDICFDYDEIRSNVRNAKSPVVRVVFHIFDNPQKKLVRERNEVSLGLRKAIEPEVSGDHEVIETKKKTPKSAKLVEPKPVISKPAFSETTISTEPAGGVGEGQRELLNLFRRFDREHDDSFILKYADGLGHEPEWILDALHYAVKQGTVKNIYAYLPTILRSRAGEGMTTKARQKARKAAVEIENRKKLASIEAEYVQVLDDSEAMKRDIVRQIVATDADATSRVIDQLKAKYKGNFGIQPGTPVEEFREKPLLRSLVLHEFRAMFSAEFDRSEVLKNLEKQLDELKNTARLIDPAFRFSG